MPGLREIRTPLAVGYAWALVLYLAFGHRLPDPAHATGLLADVYRIGRLVTPAGIAVAASVAAYLLGVIVVPVTAALTKVVLRWRQVTPARLAHLTGKSPDDQIADAFQAIVIERLADRLRDDAEFRAALVRHGVDLGRQNGAEIDQTRLDERLRRNASMRRDAIDSAIDFSSGSREQNALLPEMVQRMRGRDDRAATEYDRLASESDFRAGMAWPLLALLVVLAVRVSAWWLLGLPATLLLIASASAAALQATLLLSSVIASRRYEEPAIQIFDTIPAQQLLRQQEQPTAWLAGAARVVTTLAVSPDNMVIVGGTDDGYLFVWDAGTGGLRHSLPAHRDSVQTVVFAADSTRVVSWSSNRICVWELLSGNQVRTIPQRQILTGIEIEPGTGLLVTVEWSGLVYWDLVDGIQVRQRTFDHPGIEAIDISPAGTSVVSWYDGTVVVTRGGDHPHTAETKINGLMRCCALDDGAFVSLELDHDDVYQLTHWRHADGDLVSAAVPAPSEPYPPLVVADHRSAPILVCGNADDQVMVLSLDAAVPARAYGEYPGGITALAVSPDLTTIVAASNAGIVHVLDFSNGKLLRPLAPVAAAD
jgi:hypothetical protein